MSAVLARRAAAVVAAAAIAAGAPALGGVAHAATNISPDFTNSAFVTGGDPTDFPTVLQTQLTEVQTAQIVRVEFTGAIKLVQTGQYPGQTNDVSQSSYLMDSSSHKIGGSSVIDPNDPKRLLFTPQSVPADGTYRLHVTALNASSCPDGGLSDVLQLPACTGGFDGYVQQPGGGDFSFRFDLTGPTPTVDTVNGGNPITASGVRNVTFSGNTDNDTKSMTAYVKGSTIVGNRAIAPVTLGSGNGWHASDDLSDLPNGTYTFYVNGTDYAGNKSSAPATETFAIAAHPTAPRHVSVKPGDASAAVSWRTPSKTGGSPITAYEVVADDTTTAVETQPLALVYCNGTDCPHSAKVTGLTNGHRYGFSVFAITDVGNGDAATVYGVPKWATTLTVLGKKSLVKGASLALTGRLVRTRNDKGVKDAVVVVTPHYDNGNVGDSFKVKTDSFGTWSKAVRPKHSVRYVARFSGDAKDQPSSGHLHVDVV